MNRPWFVPYRPMFHFSLEKLCWRAGPLQPPPPQKKKILVKGLVGDNYETVPSSTRPGLKNTMASEETKTGDLRDGTWPTRVVMCNAVRYTAA